MDLLQLSIAVFNLNFFHFIFEQEISRLFNFVSHKPCKRNKKQTRVCVSPSHEDHAVSNRERLVYRIERLYLFTDAQKGANLFDNFLTFYTIKRSPSGKKATVDQAELHFSNCYHTDTYKYIWVCVCIYVYMYAGTINYESAQLLKSSDKTLV